MPRKNIKRLSAAETDAFLTHFLANATQGWQEREIAIRSACEFFGVDRGPFCLPDLSVTQTEYERHAVFGFLVHLRRLEFYPKQSSGRRKSTKVPPKDLQVIQRAKAALASGKTKDIRKAFSEAIKAAVDEGILGSAERTTHPRRIKSAYKRLSDKNRVT